jgi:branched-chain amino acid transport system substrate-binding protein
MRKSRNLWAAVACSLSLVAFAGCKSKDEKREETSKPATATPTQGARSGTHGVTDSAVTVGMDAAFTGPSAGLGIEMWRGSMAAFDEINEKGGVFGRKIRMVLADDGYEAARAAPAELKLVEQDGVFCTGWSVGTPTIVRILPVVLKYYQSEKLFHWGCFTGAQPQRNPPYDKAVFNMRASYRQETKAMVDAFVAMGRKKIGVFVQDDAYGTDGREGVARALEEHKLKLVADTRYKRGQKYEESYQTQVDLLKKQGVDAVIMVGAYQACGGFIRDARKSGWNVPIHNVSFVGADQMLDYLKKESAPNVLSNLIVTQVVPHYDEASLPSVRDYRAAMDKYHPQKPPEAATATYQPSHNYSFGSLEGYLTSRVFAMVLEKNGAKLSRESFIETAETKMSGPATPAPEAADAGDAGKAKVEKKAPAKPEEPSAADGTFDIGVGVPASFSPTDHQALDQVWFTYATPNGWKSVDNVASVIK